MLGFLRSKRFWKRAAIGIALLVAVLFIINGVVAWRVERRLQNKLAEIRAAGDPASIADLAPEPIPDDQNAAAKLKQITPRLKEFSKEYGKFFNAPIGKAYDETRHKGEPPTTEQLAAITAILDKYPDLDRDISALASYKQYASLADFSLDHQQFLESMLDEMQEVRTVARFVHLRMQVLTAEGKPEEAIRRGIELLQIAKLYDAEPLMVNFLVAAALRYIAAQSLYDALATGPLSAELHQALDEELVRHDNPQQLANALTTERAFSAGIAADAGLPGAAFQSNRFLIHVLGWPIKTYYVGMLEAYEDQLVLAARPWHEIRQQVASICSSSTGHGILADLLLPALGAAYEANARNLAVLRSLRIYHKLLEYAQANGHEAKSLDDLALPSEATIDPYTGEPLKLKLTDEGWVVYSVANNGVDDGGNFKDQNDVGVAPPAHRAH